MALYIPENSPYQIGADWRKADGYQRWIVYNYWDYYRTFKNYSRREYFLQGVMDKFDLTDEEKAYLSFLVSLTYNNATAWFIFNLLRITLKKSRDFGKRTKNFWYLQATGYM